MRKLARTPNPKFRRSSRRRSRSGRTLESSIQMNSESDGGNDRQAHDEIRAEPAVLVAFLEHGLRRAKADREGAETAKSARPIGCFALGSSVIMTVKAIGMRTPPAKPW